MVLYPHVSAAVIGNLTENPSIATTSVVNASLPTTSVVDSASISVGESGSNSVGESGSNSVPSSVGDSGSIMSPASTCIPVSDVIPSGGLSASASIVDTSSSQFVSRLLTALSVSPRCRTYHPKRISAVPLLSQRCLRAALRARLAAFHEAAFMNSPIPDSVAPYPSTSIPRSYGDLLRMPLGKERTGYLEAVRSEMASMASMQAFSELSISLADVPR